MIIKHLISFLTNTQVEVSVIHRERGRPNTQEVVQKEEMSKLRIKEEKELARRIGINGCFRQLIPRPWSDRQRFHIL